MGIATSLLHFTAFGLGVATVVSGESFGGLSFLGIATGLLRFTAIGFGVAAVRPRDATGLLRLAAVLGFLAAIRGGGSDSEDSESG